MRAGEGGFTYVALLIAIAVLGIGLAATGQVWSLASQREKEKELLFAGREFRNAITAYAKNTPGPVPRYPVKLEDLLNDNRYPGVKRYLRRIYRDPMTGKAEWGLVQAPGGGIQGVYSLSTGKPIKVAGFDYEDRMLAGAATYADWRFFHQPETPPAARAAAPAAASAR
jgi:type II secretory pathway pseudopilin PulG